MRKIKKVLALSLALAMGLSLCACGDDDESTTTESSTTEAASEADDTDADDADVEDGGDDVADDATMPVPSADGETIYAYSWNEEFGNRIQYFRDKYPDLSDLVEYVNLGMEGTSDDYKTTIGTLLEQGTSADKYPSLFAADDSLAKYFLSSDYVMPIYDAGFTDAMLANMYEYTIDYGTIDGVLKGLTWQSTPGCFCYRSDIAEEVLGVTTPDEMQALVSDWDGFWDVAEKIKEAGYYMLSGPDDLKYVCIDQNQTAWVTDDVLSIGEGAQLYLETAKKAYDNGYTKGTSAWSDGWYANMDGDVFSYFGCTWFLYWTLAPNAGSSTGNWRVCVGPASYHWGGSYVGIGKDTPNVELAALVLYTLTCDTEAMTSIVETDLDYVNNKEAIATAIADGAGTTDLLGDQNPLEIWTELADGIDLSAATSYDSAMNGYLDNAVAAYNTGEIASFDDAIANIKDQVRAGYPTITVE